MNLVYLGVLPHKSTFANIVKNSIFTVISLNIKGNNLATESWQLIRPAVTCRPAFTIRSFSIGLLGLWSVVE